jgi:hypothetical protein
VRFIALLILLAAVPAACEAAGQDEERSPLDVIGDCSDSADQETAGLTDLEEECPGLTRALEQSGYLPLLSTSLRDELDVYDLSDLLTVDDWYAEQDSAAGEPDVAALGPILDSLRAQQPERPLSWFERFKRWLRSMADQQQERDSDSWLSRWLDKTHVTETVATTILFAALAVILVLTVLVIVNELRAAGVFRKRLAVETEGGAASRATLVDDATVDVDSLPADRIASMLLRMLVTTLVQSGRLRAERSLTHRELCARAKFDDAGQRESFQRVASLAERTVYGSSEVAASEVEPIVTVARALDAQLRGAPA